MRVHNVVAVEVRGKITYGEIEIERGGEITGEIVHGSSISAKKPRPKAKRISSMTMKPTKRPTAIPKPHANGL